MAKKLIIANWKARKTAADALAWLDVLQQSEVLTITYPYTVLLAVPYTLISVLGEQIRQRNLPLLLCAQDVSAFAQGSFTGEVPAELIKEFADYVIIGHSERREYLHESEELLSKKVEQALQASLTAIYCVQNATQQLPSGVQIVAYEPPSAIGNGETAGIEDVKTVVKQLTASSQEELSILYGGSVDAENVKIFMETASLSGVLVGTKSIEAQDFVSLLKVAL